MSGPTPPPVDYVARRQADDVALFFGLLVTIFICFPVAVMAWRLLTRHREGLMSMFTPPYDIDPTKRRLSSRARHYLYQETSHGFILDVLQALLSVISCIFFIYLAYSATEDTWLTDFEDFFTVYFIIDYGLRLWLAQDTLSWYFTLTSLVDFVTVVPAISVWIMMLAKDDTDVAIIVQASGSARASRDRGSYGLRTPARAYSSSRAMEHSRCASRVCEKDRARGLLEASGAAQRGGARL